ncbi:7618_t:CDS:2, partial [Dentiscutata erythropus]
ITPGLIKPGISHGADLPIDNECSLPSKYGESLLLECLWHYVSKNWSNPISQFESHTNMKHFANNLLGMEPLAFPHSLWFGALDIAQKLITKTQKDSTLGICYYLALESLQKAPSSFIRFKAIEALIKLSKRNILFYSIIDSDFENYKQSLDPAKGLKLHHMIEAIWKAITTDSLKSPHIITPGGDFILEVVTTELSCPVTCKISKNFQILSCCKHLISSETLQQIINSKSQPTCPFCRKLINLNSVINLPQSAIYHGIRNYLPEDSNINIVQENISNESSDDEEINISKLKSQQIFRRSNPTVRKIFKAPKFLHSSLRKANTAYKLGELETTINALTEVLEEYPTSYSLQCYRAKV